jgi:hypothetical protein
VGELEGVMWTLIIWFLATGVPVTIKDYPDQASCEKVLTEWTSASESTGGFCLRTKYPDPVVKRRREAD